MSDRPIARLRRHLAIVDREVAGLVDRFEKHMTCRAGCSDCCHQTFRVAAVEGALLRRGVAALDPRRRAAIESRARAYRPDEGQPCPVLDEGSGRCQLYRHRPAICRQYGLPLWSPGKPLELRTCPLNFRDHPGLSPEDVVEPQVRWLADRVGMHEELGEPHMRRATIASWLLDGDADG